jgi:hypothetical protein
LTVIKGQGESGAIVAPVMLVVKLPLTLTCLLESVNGLTDRLPKIVAFLALLKASSIFILSSVKLYLLIIVLPIPYTELGPPV